MLSLILALRVLVSNCQSLSLGEGPYSVPSIGLETFLSGGIYTAITVERFATRMNQVAGTFTVDGTSVKGTATTAVASGENYDGVTLFSSDPSLGCNLVMSGPDIANSTPDLVRCVTYRGAKLFQYLEQVEYGPTYIIDLPTAAEALQIKKDYGFYQLDGIMTKDAYFVDMIEGYAASLYDITFSINSADLTDLTYMAVVEDAYNIYGQGSQEVVADTFIVLVERNSAITAGVFNMDMPSGLTCTDAERLNAECDITDMVCVYQCTPCGDHCATCGSDTDGVCESCEGNFKLINEECFCDGGYLPIDGECYQSNGCELNEYMSTDGRCERCESDCATCDGPNSCTSCNEHAMLVDGDCECLEEEYEIKYGFCFKFNEFVCPIGFMLIGTDSCMECPDNCLACDTSGCLVCTEYRTGATCDCPSGFSEDNDGECECPSGSYVDDTADPIECNACTNNCKECDAPGDSCTVCGLNAQLDGSSCECVNASLVFDGNNDCTDIHADATCDPICKTCAGADKKLCESCSAPMVLEEGRCVCPEGIAFDYVTEACTSVCPMGCLECLNSQHCTLCDHSKFFMMNEDDYCVCVEGYEQEGEVCLPHNIFSCNSRSQYGNDCEDCPSTCGSCWGSDPRSCLACANYMMHLSNDNMMSPLQLNLASCECPEGYYYDHDNKECLRCGVNCRRCTGPTQTECLECIPGTNCLCPTGMENLNGHCLLKDGECEYYEYADGDECELCEWPCVSCTAAACNFCDSPYVLDDSDNCVCDDGYYLSSEGWCEKCDSNCKTCETSAENCLECAENLTKDDQNRCVCPSGMMKSVHSGTCDTATVYCDPGEYYDSRGKCMSCHASCHNCFGPYLNECITCKHDLARLYHETSPGYGTCRCPTGHFLNSQGHCERCHSSCRECYGSEWYMCSECPETATFINESPIFYCKCQSSYTVVNDGQCGLPASSAGCEANCIACHTESGSSVCDICSTPLHPVDGSCGCYSGTYLSNGICKNCPVNCRDCDQHGHCTTCSDYSTYNENTERCECKSGYFETSSGECVLLGTSFNCNYYQFWDDETGRCENCHYTCKTCDGYGENECVSCWDGLALNNNNECRCAQGYYDAGSLGTSGSTTATGVECEPCMPGCRSCIDGTGCPASECVSYDEDGNCGCLDGLEWDYEELECLPIGSNDDCEFWEFYFEEDEECYGCPSNCRTCIMGFEDNTCITCTNGEDLIPGTTSNVGEWVVGMCGDCPSGMYADNDTRECKECDPKCSECFTDSYCTACREGAELVGSSCSCVAPYTEYTTGCKILDWEECGARGQIATNSGTPEAPDYTCTPCTTVGCDYCSPGDTCTICADGKQLFNDLCIDCATTECTCTDTDDCTGCHDPLKDPATQCQSCLAGNSPDALGVCVSDEKCPDGQYGSVSTGCLPCNLPCETCTGPAEFECITCVSPLIWLEYECGCPEGQYKYNDTDCVPCGTGCESCDEFGCDECYPGFVEHYVLEGFITYMYCMCPVNTIQVDGECVSDYQDPVCGEGEFSSDGTTCTACAPECFTCKDAADTCMTCTPGYNVSDNGDGTVTCTLICPYASYNDNGTCTPCNPGCLECTSTECEYCEFPSTPNGANCECGPKWASDPTEICVLESECGPHQEDEFPACLDCTSDCYVCDADDLDDCIGCNVFNNEVLETDPGTGKGVCNCKDGHYRATDGSCRECGYMCKACSSDTACDTCEGFFVTMTGSTDCMCDTTTSISYGEECWSLTLDPPDGKYYMDAELTEGDCHSACATCVGPLAEHCTSCATDYRKSDSFHPDLVHCDCPSGTYGLDQACSGTCADMCASCSGPDITECTECVYRAYFLASAGTAECRCDSGLHWNNDMCEPIPETACADFSQYHDGTACADCHVACWSCYGGGPDNCNVCRNEMHFAEQDGTYEYTGTDPTLEICVCDNGGLFDEDTQTCNECTDVNCLHCIQSGGVEVCDECNSLSTLNDAGTCECLANTTATATGCQINKSNADCPERHYYDSGLDECFMCPDTACIYCEEANVCITCEGGKTFTDGCSCPEGTYDTGKGCESCNFACSICYWEGAYSCNMCNQTAGFVHNESQTCECASGTYLDSSDNTCKAITSLPVGTYTDENGDEQDCHPKCYKCLGGSEDACVECHDNSYFEELDDYLGTCHCNDGYYSLSDGCGRCHHACTKCITSSYSDCLECAPGFMMVPNYDTIVSCECQTGYEFNDQNECELKQDSGERLGYYYVNGVELECHKSCAKCEGPEEHECTACWPFAEHMVNFAGSTIGECHCLESYYLFEDGEESICEPCHDTCYQCSGWEETDCTSCGGDNFNMQALQDQHKCICLEMYQFDSKAHTCYIATSDGCTETGTYFDSAVGICLPCIAGCAFCHGPSIADCDVCGENRSMDNDCGCVQGYYEDTSSFELECRRCHYSCEDCDGPNNTDCNKCDLNFSETFTNNVRTCECNVTDGKFFDTVTFNCINPSVDPCTDDKNQNQSQGQGRNESKECVACENELCSYCYAYDECITCKQGLIATPKASGNSGVYCECADFNYFEPEQQNCLPCDPTCKSCSGHHEYECLECSSDRELVLTTLGQVCNCLHGYKETTAGCVPEGSSDDCRPEEYMDDGSCKPCDGSCNTCIGGTEDDCIVCLDNAKRLYEDLEASACVCMDKFFRPTGSNDCVACLPNCKTCDSDSSCTECPYDKKPVDTPNADCTQCIDGYIPNSTYTGPEVVCVADESGLDSCELHFYSIDGTCEPCHDSCLHCDGPNPWDCTSCRIGFEPSSVSGGNYYCNCFEGHYYNEDDGKCMSCHPHCKYCDDDTMYDCLECRDDMTHVTQVATSGTSTTVSICECTGDNEWSDLEEQCVSADCGDTGYFEGGICWPCHYTCNGCSGPGAYDCDACPTGLTLDSGACGCSDTNSYYSETSLTCQVCPAMCATCENDIYCTSCIGGAVLEHGEIGTLTTMLCDCTHNLEYDSETKTCVAVTTSYTGDCYDTDICQSCAGPNEDQCMTCESSMISMPIEELEDIVFVHCYCPDATFWDGSTCSPCGANCEMCTSSSACDVCKVLFVPDNAGGCECQAGLTDNGNGECIDNTAVCQPGTYQSVSSGNCEPCDSSCVKCIAGGPNNCSECRTSLDFELVVVSSVVGTATTAATAVGTCECKPGTYYEENENSCKICHFTCDTCEFDGEWGCKTCKDPTATTTAGTEFSMCSCPDTKAMNANGMCEDPLTSGCPDICSECTTTGECVSCKYTVNEENECACFKGLYLGSDDMCHDCNPECEACEGAAEICVECRDDAEFDATEFTCYCTESGFEMLDGICVPTQGSNENCLPNEFLSGNDCFPCDKRCFTCTGGTNADCDLCGIGTETTSTGTCECADGYLFSDAMGCEECDFPCTACENSSDFCTRCGIVGWKLSTTPGTCECAEGYVPEADQCIREDGCLTNQFFKEECHDCDDLCLTCENEADHCTSCDDDKGLRLVAGTCECYEGYYLSEDECHECHHSCRTCSDYDTCTSCDTQVSTLIEGKCECNTDYYRNAFSDTCREIDECPGGIMNMNSVCESCHYTCETCSGFDPSDCLSCHATALNRTQSYISEKLSRYTCGCLEGQLMLENGSCINCDPSCKSCFGDSEDECSACHEHAILQTLGTLSYCECADGYEMDSNYICTPVLSTECPVGQFVTSAGACEDCPPLCMTCQSDNPDSCISCFDGVEFHQMSMVENLILGTCTCSEGTYRSLNTDDEFECFDCDPVCRTCTKSGPENCVKCADFHVKDGSGICVCEFGTTTGCEPPESSCGEGYFLGDDGCEECYERCLTCVGTSNGDCTSCKPGENRNLEKLSGFDSGYCVCSDGYFSNNEHCEPCDSSCETCYGGSYMECLTCKGGAVPTPTTVNTVTVDVCDCPSGETWDPVANTCLDDTNCTGNEYFDVAINDCEACSSTCDGCIGFENYCLECSDPTNMTKTEIFDSVFSCKCNPGKFLENSACTACDPVCSECERESDNCLVCADPARTRVLEGTKYICECPQGYQDDNGTCVVETVGNCAEYQYLDEDDACQDCDPHCAVCEGGEPGDCLSCKTGGFLENYSAPSKCVAEFGYTFDETLEEFAACPDFCEMCTSDNGALVCEYCSMSYYKENDTTCTLCDTKCHSCDATGCTSCRSDMKLNGTDCECLNGYEWNPGLNMCQLIEFFPNCDSIDEYELSEDCYKCDSSCASCVSPDDKSCLACDHWQGRVFEEVREVADSAGNTLKVGSCVCREGYSFFNDGCQWCHNGCKTCTQNMNNFCESCIDNAHEVYTTSTEFSCECDNGYFLLSVSGSDRLECLQPPEGYYLDDLNREIPCHHSCKSCSYSDEYSCLVCPDNREFSDPDGYPNFCVCKEGYEDSSGTCSTDCADLCDTCSGPNPEDCMMCIEGAEYDYDEMSCMCGQNFDETTDVPPVCTPKKQEGCTAENEYNDGSACVACHDSCRTCNDGGINHCLTCDTTAYVFVELENEPEKRGRCDCIEAHFRTSTNVCLPCPTNCLSCDEDEDNPGTAICNMCEENRDAPGCTCTSGYILDDDDCVLDTSNGCDPPGFYGPNCSTPCHTTCAACLNESTNCIACDNGKILEPDDPSATPLQGKCVCPPGTFIDGSNCTPCEYPCLDCTATSCEVCDTDNDFELNEQGECVCSGTLTLDSSTMTCFDASSCDPGETFDVVNGICVGCFQTCSTCAGLGFDQCTSCKGGFEEDLDSTTAQTFECVCPQGATLIGSSCITCGEFNSMIDISGTSKECTCEPNYTIDTDNTDATVFKCVPDESLCPSGVCDSCDASCLTCSVDADSSKCLSCHDNASPPENADPAAGFACVCDQNFGLTAAGTCGDCVDQGHRCGDCIQDVDTCVDCKAGHERDENDDCVCLYLYTYNSVTGECDPPSTSGPCEFNFYETSSGECEKCDRSCYGCEGAGSLKCTGCNENATPDSDGSCYCNKGFYFELTSGKCQGCDPNCVDCEDSPDTCIECQPDSETLNVATDVCECSTGYTGTVPDCELDTGGCDEGSYDPGSGCVPCDPSCKSCSGGTAADCIVCADDYEMVGGSCTIVCDPICATCEGSASDCTACSPVAIEVSQVSGTSLVICECDPEFFIPTDDGRNCIQIPSCPNGEYYSVSANSCVGCTDSLCEDCDGPNQCYSCIEFADDPNGFCECIDDYHFDTQVKSCVPNPTCPTGTYLNTAYECDLCDGTCLGCAGPSDSECTSCKENISLTITTAGSETGVCLCPTGEYFDEFDKACQSCSSGCLDCTQWGNEHCGECNVGYTKPLFECVCNTDNRYYRDNSDGVQPCKECHGSCETCYSSNQNNNCMSCPETYILVQEGPPVEDGLGYCNCDPDHYYDENQGYCIELPLECQGQNIYYDNEDCLDCAESCSKCSGPTDTDCTLCPAGYMFTAVNNAANTSADVKGTCTCITFASDGTCVTGNCPPGQYYEQIDADFGYCEECPETCETCNGGSASNCVECPYNYKRSQNLELNSTCVCRDEYKDLTDPSICHDEKPVDNTTNCPLPAYICELAIACVWDDNGQLVQPTSDDCIAAIYAECCIEDCPGYTVDRALCQEIAPPEITEAKFTDNGEDIKIHFDYPIIMLVSNCEDLFLDSSTLGTYPYCDYDWDLQRTIYVYPDWDANIEIGQTLTLNEDVYMSSHPYALYSNLMYDIIIEGPDNVPETTVTLEFPDKVSACTGSFGIFAFVDPESATTSYSWQVSGASYFVDPYFEGLVTINSFASSTAITLGLTVTNFGVQYTRQEIIEVYQENVPVLVLPYEIIEHYVEDFLWVDSWVEIDPNCSGNQVFYTWSSNDINLSEISTTSDPFLILPENSLLPGTTYTITVSASYDTSTVSSQKSLTVITYPAEIYVFIDGGDREISRSKSVTLDGSNSVISSTQVNSDSTAWQYIWTCEDWTAYGEENPYYETYVDETNLSDDLLEQIALNPPQDCTLTLLAGIDRFKSTLEIPASTLDYNGFYYFGLEVRDNNANVSGLGYSSIKVKAEPTGLQQISVSISTTYNQIKPNKKNKLTANLESGVTVDNLAYFWEFIGSGVTVDMKPKTITKKKLKYTVDNISESAIYKFRVTITGTNIEPATDTISISVNGPPYGGTAVLSPNSGTYDTAFTLTFSGWKDRSKDKPFTYGATAYYSDASSYTSDNFCSGTKKTLTCYIPFDPSETTVQIEPYVEDSEGNYAVVAPITVTFLPPADSTAALNIFETQLNSFTASKASNNKSERLNGLIQLGNIIKAEESVRNTYEEVISSDIATECTGSDSQQDANYIRQCFAIISSTADSIGSIAETGDAMFETLITSIISLGEELNDSEIEQCIVAGMSFSFGSSRRLSETVNTNVITGRDSFPNTITNGIELAPGEETTVLTGTSNYYGFGISSDTSTSGLNALSYSVVNTTRTGTVEIPDIFLTSGAEYECSIWSQNTTYSIDSVLNTTSRALTMNCLDASTNTEVFTNSNTCTEYIHFTMEYEPIENIYFPNAGDWYANGTAYGNYTDAQGNTAVASNFTNFVGKCTYFNTTSNTWVYDEGVNNTLTWINWPTLTIHCYSCHMSTYTSVSGFPASISVEEYDPFEEFNGLYLSSGLVFISLGIAIVAYVIGAMKNEFVIIHPFSFEDTPDPKRIGSAVQRIAPDDRIIKEEKLFQSVSDKMPVEPTPGSMEGMQVGKENDVSNLNLTPAIESPSSSLEDIKATSYMKMHLLVTGLFYRGSYSYPRYLRVISFFSTLLLIILIAGVLPNTDNFIVLGVYAWLTSILIYPLFTCIYFVPLILSGCLRTTKIIVSLVVYCLVVAACILVQYMMTDRLTKESDNEDWLYGSLIAIGLFFAVTEPALTFFKYLLHDVNMFKNLISQF